MALGVTSNKGIYSCVLGAELLSLFCLVLSKLNCLSMDLALKYIAAKHTVGFKLEKRLVNIFSNNGIRLNYHISTLMGLTSILWSGHIVHCAIPASRGISGEAMSLNYKDYLDARYYGIKGETLQEGDNHVFGASAGSGKSLLTFIGGLSPDCSSIYLSDISHHHLALGVLLIWASHLYRTFYKGVGHNIRELCLASNPGIGANIREVSNSRNLQLSLALFAVGSSLALLTQLSYILPSHPYIEYDLLSSVSLYVHHTWILFERFYSYKYILCTRSKFWKNRGIMCNA